jgi:hypothetical protein
MKIKKINTNFYFIFPINIIIIYFHIYFLSDIKTCFINKETTGYCIEKEKIIEKVNFCKDFLPNNICIPFENVRN